MWGTHSKLGVGIMSGRTRDWEFHLRIHHRHQRKRLRRECLLLSKQTTASRETVLVIRVVCKSRVLERREAKIRSIVYEWHSV